VAEHEDYGMRLIGMMPCRNEDWVLSLSARAALRWCDALVILNHASTDRTADIISGLCKEFPGRIDSFSVSDGEWREMDQRQALLEFARRFEPTHLAIIDADEVLTGNLLGQIRVAVEALPRGSMLQLPGYNLRGGLDRYHANGIWGQRWFSVAYIDDPRLGWRGDRFHQREPGGAFALRWMQRFAQGQGGVMHLWGASERRLRAKHAAYKMIETLRWPNKPKAQIEQLYSLAFVPAANRDFEQDWRYADVPAEWWQPYGALRSSVELEAAPWQEEMCRKLLAEHGAERFAGLDLLGVCGDVLAEAR
jgi:hypothetical protein